MTMEVEGGSKSNPVKQDWAPADGMERDNRELGLPRDVA